MSTADSVLGVLTSVLPKPCALHEPEFAGREWEYVKSCLDSGWVSSSGAFVDRLENDLVEVTGCGHAIATVNGTAALHLCLRLAGVVPGDRVVVPALSFVATANAVDYCGATCLFVDAAPDTLGLDPGKLDRWLEDEAWVNGETCHERASGRAIRAAVCMHTFGHPADLDAIAEVCARWKLVLIEDAAESLGSEYKGRHTGSVGRLAALSFNGNKVVTTGGGGAALTGDGELARRAKHLATTAKQAHRWEYIHDEVGYNYRLPNINAALGCAQLEQLPGFVEDKRRLAQRYAAAFADVPGVEFVNEPAFARSNYWLNAVLVADAAERDAVLERTNAAGYMTRPAWRLLSALPMYADAPRMDLSVAENFAARLVNVPSSPFLVRG